MLTDRNLTYTAGGASFGCCSKRGALEAGVLSGNVAFALRTAFTKMRMLTDQKYNGMQTIYLFFTKIANWYVNLQCIVLEGEISKTIAILEVLCNIFFPSPKSCSN